MQSSSAKSPVPATGASPSSKSTTMVASAKPKAVPRLLAENSIKYMSMDEDYTVEVDMSEHDDILGRGIPEHLGRFAHCCLF